MFRLTLDTGPITRLFKTLGDETRLRIVALLSHGALCVCQIETALNLTQPNASRHLAVLKSAGIVAPFRRGKWVYYKLAPQVDEACRKHLNTLVRNFAAQPQLRRDIKRLTRLCGPELRRKTEPVGCPVRRRGLNHGRVLVHRVDFGLSRILMRPTEEAA